jgi:hypothetical protein
MPSGSVRVAEYFYKEYQSFTLVQLKDGRRLIKERMPADISEADLEGARERQSSIPVICWLKMTGLEILESTKFPGELVPIVPVIGSESDVDGKVTLKGITRDAKDPQRLYNYAASSEAEMIALAPRAPWVGAEGQFEGHEQRWAEANRKNFAFLEYKPVTHDGNLAPPPARNVQEPPILAFTQARIQSADDIKSTTGIYDASLGARSNETSGRAIDSRKIQGQTSNLHFVDNLRRSKRQVGRIIVGAMPQVYDTERAVRIIGEDGEQEIVTLNRIMKDGQMPEIGDKSYHLSIGKYDVTIDEGPSFATKRQEAVASILDLLQKYPNAGPAIADLLVKNMDIPEAKEISQRLRKMVPPGLVDDKKDGKPIPPEIQAQIQQQNEMIDQLTKALNEASEQIKTKQAELESRERIEFSKMHVDLLKKLEEIGSKESIALLSQEMAGISRRLELLQINEPIDIENENGAGPEQAEPPIQNQNPGTLTPDDPGAMT